MEHVAWILQHYEAVAQLSGRMLEAARKELWDELIELELQRNSVLSELKSDVGQAAIPGEATEQVAKLIGSVLAADKEIEVLARAWRDELQGLLGSINTERKLSDTYGE